MTAPQTKLFSGIVDGQANSALRSSTIGIISVFIYPYRDRVEPSLSDYSFTPSNPPSTSGGSVSVGPLRGPLRRSFHSLSTSGLTRKVWFSTLGGVRWLAAPTLLRSKLPFTLQSKKSNVLVTEVNRGR